MIKIEVEFDQEELRKQLEKLPGLMQGAAYDKGLRPATNVVKRRIAALALRSSATGSTRKWSDKTRSARGGERPLYKMAKVKLWRSRKGISIGLAGFEFPKGNIGYLSMAYKKSNRRVFLWGRPTGRTVRKEDTMKRAFDDTKSQAAAAFTAAVTSEVQKKLKELARG